MPTRRPLAALVAQLSPGPSRPASHHDAGRLKDGLRVARDTVIARPMPLLSRKAPRVRAHALRPACPTREIHVAPACARSPSGEQSNGDVESRDPWLGKLAASPEAMSRAKIALWLSTLATALGASSTVTLNNGVVMPIVAAGTWQYDTDAAEQSITAALGVGARHIDTAHDYCADGSTSDCSKHGGSNQQGIAKALKSSSVARSDLFITTKVPPCGMQGVSRSKCTDDTVAAAQKNLDELGTSYVDLLLIHFPPVGGCGALNCGVIREQWKALATVLAANQTRTVGVSNFCISCFKCLEKDAGAIVPAVNQVEYQCAAPSACSNSRAHDHSPRSSDTCPVTRVPCLPCLPCLQHRHGRRPRGPDLVHELKRHPHPSLLATGRQHDRAHHRQPRDVHRQGACQVGSAGGAPVDCTARRGCDDQVEQPGAHQAGPRPLLVGALGRRDEPGRRRDQPARLAILHV